jgi:hypothetical protein
VEAITEGKGDVADITEGKQIATTRSSCSRVKKVQQPPTDATNEKPDVAANAANLKDGKDGKDGIVAPAAKAVNGKGGAVAPPAASCCRFRWDSSSTSHCQF